MTLRILESFRILYKCLPGDIQQRVDRTVHLLIQNPRHPSLHTKKMQGPGNVWEVRVSRNYRVTFFWESDVIILRRVGTHDILKKESP